MVHFRNVIDKLFYDKTGQTIVSAIFGLALSFMFVRICKNNCIVYYAPDISEIKDNTYKIEETCYKYSSIPTKCNETALENYNSNIIPDNLIKGENFFTKLFS